MSGSSRQLVPDAPQVTEDCGTAAVCHAGRPQNCETPPPEAPAASSHTLSPPESRWVPPTEVTQGWELGSSTESWPLPQSFVPASPAAAITVCPWTAASSKSVFSAASACGPISASHSPHDVETTCAASWVTIALYVS